MKLTYLTAEQCQIVRHWRNAEMECWRTPFILTHKMQEDFYIDIVSNRESNHRYWALLKDGGVFIGMGGITYIQQENRIGEITLIIDPDQRKNGSGEKAVDLLLDQAFNYLNLRTVFGECYTCNSAFRFWGNITDKHKGFVANLPNRKYWQGEYYSSLYFSIDKNDFNNRNK